MTERGELHDTYAAALRTGTASIPTESVLFGVVRRPMGWLHAQIDENLTEFGPPDSLLDEVHRLRDDLRASGENEATAHNTAMDQAGFEARYLEHLSSSEPAQQARERVLDMLAAGENVVLVCYENTDEKRCHRTTLKQWIEDARVDD